MSLNSENIRLEPCDVHFGDYQVQTVKCTADVASSHNNDYFFIWSALDAVKYYVWMNVGGAGVDPAPGGATGIEVDFAANASAATVAAAIAAALQAEIPFIASVDTSDSTKVIVKNAQPGLSTTVAAGVGLTGFVYALVTAGSLDDLGLLEGDIEVTFEEKSLDITAHQTGADILAKLRQGKISKVKLTMQETDNSKMNFIFKQAGSNYTPSGGTQVVGWGSSTNSLNVIPQSKKLILHPHVLASSDRSRDLSFWLAYLTPGSVKFSGEKQLMIECEFQTFTDTKRVSEVDLFVYGDHLQDFKA